MDRNRLSAADIRDMHRFALTQRSLARHQGDLRRVRLCHRLVVKCRRTLRRAARMKTEWVLALATGPTCPTDIFSATLENFQDTPRPTAAPKSDRHRAFRERLLR